ncbi:MAG: helix-turn-helix domain-containing protein [Pyrinomonadaceae bacterium]|nr:helix-turn-helix domain-containing protein [Pyrinomonadaceae bacterium]
MLPEEIRQKRLELNLTQTELAERFGVDGNTIARWERGEIIPKAQGMLQLAFQSLEIEKGSNILRINQLQGELKEKVQRLRIRHTKNKKEWNSLNK